MQYTARWHQCWHVPVFIACLCVYTLSGCSETGNDAARVDGTTNLTALNAAAVGGLTFRFADGAIFGFTGQSLSLALGADGTTFTLTTSGGTVIPGTLLFGSCTFTQTPTSVTAGATPLVQTYTTCQAMGIADGDIDFGGSGNGKLMLRLGLNSEALVTSDPLTVIYTVDVGGHITINSNTTPIGVIG